MGSWHKCETTHCRAGWVTTLAGKEGAKLESKFGTGLAAMLIYRESSKIKVTWDQFYVTNEDGLADMKRCADLEKG